MCSSPFDLTNFRLVESAGAEPTDMEGPLYYFILFLFFLSWQVFITLFDNNQYYVLTIIFLKDKIMMLAQIQNEYMSNVLFKSLNI